MDLIQAIGNIPGSEVLEFGSGRGEFTVALAKLGASATGIDVGEDLVKLARRVALLNQVQCEYVVGRIEELPF